MRTALLWIIAASKARTGETIEERIAREMVAIVNGEETPAVRQKMETHKTAMQNRCVQLFLCPLTSSDVFHLAALRWADACNLEVLPSQAFMIYHILSVATIPV